VVRKLLRAREKRRQNEGHGRRSRTLPHRKKEDFGLWYLNIVQQEALSETPQKKTRSISLMREGKKEKKGGKTLPVSST